MSGLTRRHLLAGAAASITTTAYAQASTTLFVSHPAMRGHDPGPGWPDRPDRLRVLEEMLATPRFAALTRIEAPTATRAAILRVHAPELLARLEQASPMQGTAQLGNDVVMNAGTLSAALHAAGGGVAAIEAVMRGHARNAFVATRPPGHHARAEAPMGFCFLNNAAIAARHARETLGATRIAIVDFDVHHGNGVQEIFWNDKNTLYCSTHQMPLYPGTGAASETGAHDNIVNAPLGKGDDGEKFREALTTRILPRLDAFAPDLILFCAGFDAHLHDPLGRLRFVEEDFRDVTLRVMEIAARRCNGRIVSLLEGGYAPNDLAASVAAHVGAMMTA
jgi:acetoin utilization deacetylase AcuC-like enzyme